MNNDKWMRRVVVLAYFCLLLPVTAVVGFILYRVWVYGMLNPGSMVALLAVTLAGAGAFILANHD